jgi:predicted phage tail protein
MLNRSANNAGTGCTLPVARQASWHPSSQSLGAKTTARSHDMNTPSNRSKPVEIIGLLGIGALLLAVAAFVDPVGSSPDTGVLDLGSSGTKWLLGAFGVFFIAAGIRALVKPRRTK